MTMPFGWKISQVKAEQPTTVYGDFKHEVINEIARCLNMPFNIAAGNSSGYNYASGRLDHQAFFKAIRIDQAYLADVVLLLAGVAGDFATRQSRGRSRKISDGLRSLSFASGRQNSTRSRPRFLRDPAY